MRMTLNGYTIYKNIKAFPPAHYFSSGKFKRYWDLQIESKQPPKMMN